MSKYRLYPVIVCTHQSDGAPAFHVCTPQVTLAQIEEGDHYEQAIKNARDLGYEGAAVAFDMTDPAASQLHALSVMYRKAKGAEIALDILRLDGAKITGNEDDDLLSERAWDYQGKVGEGMTHVSMSKGEAALMFVSCAYPCSQNDWLKEVNAGATTDSYLDWADAKMRDIRAALQKRTLKNRIQCESDPNLFWSNEFGWVSADSADAFSDEEMATLNLPVEGKWVDAKATTEGAES